MSDARAARPTVQRDSDHSYRQPERKGEVVTDDTSHFAITHARSPRFSRFPITNDPHSVRWPVSRNRGL